MTAEPSELDTSPDLSVILPDTARLEVDGIEVRVKRLRAREVLALARIIASGLGDGVMDMRVDWNDSEEVKGALLGMMLVALPLAEEEAIAFFRTLVVPVDSSRAGELADLMGNPDPGVLLDLLDAVVDQEGPALLDLVGKARQLAAKVGTLFSDRKTGAVGGRAPGRGRSTSSRRSTDGPTTKP